MNTLATRDTHSHRRPQPVERLRKGGLADVLNTEDELHIVIQAAASWRLAKEVARRGRGCSVDLSYFEFASENDETLSILVVLFCVALLKFVNRSRLTINIVDVLDVP